MCPAHRDLPTPSHPHSRLNLPHPIPSHTYNGLKTFSLSTTPPGRSPPSAQPFVPSTVAYRHKSTKLPSSTTKHSKKKPEGCAEGPWLYGPFAVFHSFPKQKKQALCQETKTKTKNQPHNKQRKRKSQRKIKKKNKRKNKGENA